MAANDIFMVTLKTGVTGSYMRNVFFYQVTPASSNAGAPDLRVRFDADVVAKQKAITSTSTPYLGIDIVNLFNNADFENYLYSPAGAGARTGETMPLFNTIKFKSAKPTSSQQPARKAIGFLSESDVNGGLIITGGAYQTACNAYAAQLGTNLVFGGTTTFAPVIVKRIPYITEDGKKAYRVPTNISEAVTYPAINWQLDTILKPQVTRTPGRGI